jgi:hypothetical protein
MNVQQTFRVATPTHRRVYLLLSLAIIFIVNVAGATEATTTTGLDRGFARLYNLDFSGAQKEFLSWESQNPDNAMGPVSEAAGILFSEFDRLGVLETQFYENDSAFSSRKKYNADPKQRALFEQQLTRAETLGKARLARDPQDHDALLGMTLASGLRADYAALIEKRSLSSLHYTKDSTAWADQLLATHPECYDAYLAGGISRYHRLMSAPVRGYAHGRSLRDKARGVSELRRPLQRRLLAPFARILLAKPRPRQGHAARSRDPPHASEGLSQQSSFPA